MSFYNIIIIGCHGIDKKASHLLTLYIADIHDYHPGCESAVWITIMAIKATAYWLLGDPERPS